MRINRFILILLFLPVGCARFQPRPISPGETASAWQARSLDNPALKAFLEKNLSRKFGAWPLKSWDFETLNLAAFYYHPSLDVARAQWQVALGGNLTAAQRPNPTITASPGYDFTATSLGTDPWIPGVTFDVPIETMGKRGYRKAQARFLSDSARLNIAAIAWEVRRNLRAALIELAAAQQRAALLQKQSAVQEQIVQSLAEQVNSGEASSVELTPVKLISKKLQVDLADARRQTVDARFRVADALGLPEAGIAGVDFAFELSERHPEATEFLSAEVRDAALRSRPDILGALADYAASQSALQLQIAKQYPDIHFGPYYQYNQGDHQFTLSVSVELPLLNQNQGPIAEAEAHRTEMVARFNELQAKVINEIDHTMAAYRVAQENLETLQSLASTQKQQSDAVAAQAEAGAADRFDTLNAQVELAASELVQLDGRVQAQQAFAALEDAVQRPIDALGTTLIQPPRSLQAMKENQP